MPEARGATRISLWLATAGGAGLVPRAPGTAGAIVGVLFFLAFAQLNMMLYGITLITLTVLGVWVSDVAERFYRSEDDGRIVIDEVVGQLVALTPLLPSVSGLRLFSGTGIFLIVTGFVAFRVLDIWKPGPVGWAQDHFEGGLGVMADDVVAGVLGALLLSGLLAALWLGWWAT
ncbi:MAG: phosphatidylglycerophosphatase A [Proteobacteria bacterium]|nr:phosphatidylglycerophosphatase A [Pseudomonadota bacterium]